MMASRNAEVVTPKSTSWGVIEVVLGEPSIDGTRSSSSRSDLFHDGSMSPREDLATKSLVRTRTRSKVTHCKDRLNTTPGSPMLFALSPTKDQKDSSGCLTKAPSSPNTLPSVKGWIEHQDAYCFPEILSYRGEPWVFQVPK